VIAVQYNKTKPHSSARSIMYYALITTEMKYFCAYHQCVVTGSIFHYYTEYSSRLL
jgi:hypothetical protein